MFVQLSKPVTNRYSKLVTNPNFSTFLIFLSSKERDKSVPM
nr:MAG TPA: hypothetical protein [Caudoviricetes sp.]